MKNVIKILLLFILCSAHTCRPIPEENENCHLTIYFSNNSEKNLRVTEVFVHQIFFPDPFDTKTLSSTAELQKYKINSSEQNNRDAMYSNLRCYEDIFKRDTYSDEVYVYIFDAELIENTPWEVVTRDYLVLKRYDLTLSDLQRLDWRVTYPPTEAMKDIKQYPPYG